MTEAAYAHEDSVHAARPQLVSPARPGLDRQPTERQPRELAEPIPARFRHDFSQVRVHTDEREPDRAAGIPPSVPEVLARDGKPLDAPLRAVMERHLRAGLGAVRVHADNHAGASARTIGANAYAVGHHVVFGPGRFNPATSAGKRLLAHELTHVVQQGA